MKVRFVIKEEMASTEADLQTQLDDAVNNAVSNIDNAPDKVAALNAINQAINLLNGVGTPNREKYVKGMKSSKKDFKKRYGKDAEDVMYATATKMAMKKKKK
jgi:nickel-dependent lactate racemase